MTFVLWLFFQFGYRCNLTFVRISISQNEIVVEQINVLNSYFRPARWVNINTETPYQLYNPAHRKVKVAIQNGDEKSMDDPQSSDVYFPGESCTDDTKEILIYGNISLSRHWVRMELLSTKLNNNWIRLPFSWPGYLINILLTGDIQ